MPDPSDYTVGWICALTTELTAARAFLDEKHDKNDLDPAPDNDDNSYELGRIGKHNVVLAVLPQYGLVNAATVAKDMARTFPNIRFGLMVGIGGGAPSSKHDIRLGDVVVSARGDGHGGVFQYDLGKALQVDDQFQRTGSLNQPPQALLIAMRALASQYELEGHDLEASVQSALAKFPRLRRGYAKPASETDRLFRSHVLHPSGSGDCTTAECASDPSNMVARAPRAEDEDDPAVHYGLIASANTVLKNAQIRDRLVAEEGVLCFEMEAAGLMNLFPCLIIRGISDYCDSHKQKAWQGYAAMTAAAYAKDLLLHISPRQVEREKPVREVLGSLEQSVQSLKVTLDEANTATKAVRQDLDLAKLPIASGASFNSHAEEHNAHCLPETRAELLQRIEDWAASTSDRPVFWLSGMAGTGKSTIARTLAQSFASRGELGASFFFKKGDSHRGKAARFFTTIAADLLRAEPALEPAVRKALRAEPDISERPLAEQFEKLIMQPLLSMRRDQWRSSARVVVVDALDECQEEQSASVILKSLAQTGRLGSKPLRIFVTSRPDFHIRLGFKEMPDGTHQDFLLHQIPRPIIDRDIRLFINHELGVIRKQRGLESPWPTAEETSVLVQLATPLFIFAATMCRYIGTKGANPNVKLNRIILSGKSTLDQVDQLYFTVLDDLFQEQDREDRAEWLDDFRAVVGTIVLLMRPLSIHSLSRLLGRRVSYVRLQLDALNSVLQVPDDGDMPVQVLHLSFREFLTDPEKKGQSPFWIEERKIHQQLASDCLRLMESSLRRDICGLKEPAARTDEVSSEALAAHVPPQLQYACRYWVDHLDQGRRQAADDGDEHQFLKKHLLHWLEAMILMQEYADCVRLITKLQSNTASPEGPLSQFLRDARRFVLRFRFVVVDTPLQLYSSALLFAPEECLVRLNFAGQENTGVTMLSRRATQWDPCLVALEGHSSRENIYSVAFAPDGQTLASAASDGTVRLWETATGVCLTVINLSPLDAMAVVFSPDGQLLALAVSDWTVRLWDVATKTYRTSLSGHSSVVEAIVFSPDQTLLATASRDKTVRLWETATWACCAALGHEQVVTSVAFSPQDALLATASRNSTAIRLWAVPPRLGAQPFLRRLEGHSKAVRSITFSPTIKGLFASYSVDGTIRLWHTEGSCIFTIQLGRHGGGSSMVWSKDHVIALASGNDIQLWDLAWDDPQFPTVPLAASHRAELEGHTNLVSEVAISPDGKTLASGSFDSTARLWEVKQAKRQHKLERHSRPVSGVCFSPDGMLVASWSIDGTSRLWNTETGACHATLGDFSDSLTPAVFAPDGKQLATICSYTTVWLWDLGTLECSHILGSDDDAVREACYSPDGRILALVFKDHTVRLWDTATGTYSHVLRGHTSWIDHALFSPDGTLIASVSRGRAIRLWETKSGSCRAEFVPDSESNAVAFSPDGKLLVTTGASWINFYDTATGESRGTLSPHNDAERRWFRTKGATLGFTPDGLSLHKDQQNIPLPEHLRQEASAEKTRQAHITVQEDWVVDNGRKLFRIPVEQSHLVKAVWRNKICLGSRSGQVLILKVGSE